MMQTRSEVINTFGEAAGEALIDAGLASVSAVQREITEEGGLRHIQGIGPAREVEIMDALSEAEEQAQPEPIIEEEAVSQEVYQFDTEYEVVEEFDNPNGNPSGYSPGDVVMNFARDFGLNLVREGKIRKKRGGLRGFTNPRPLPVRRLQERRARAGQEG